MSQMIKKQQVKTARLDNHSRMINFHWILIGITPKQDIHLNQKEGSAMPSSMAIVFNAR
jgi:hypothetical protein